MSLYHKYRPPTFKEVQGNTAQVKSLRTVISAEAPSHVYMLSGPRGVGKTTLARICAGEFKAHPTSILEHDCAAQPKVEQVRAILDRMKLLPFSGTASVYIFDEAHRLTIQAQEALLKATEDTPEHVYIFICTSKASKIDDALASRGTQIKLKALTNKTLEKILYKVVVAEDIDSTKVTDEVVSTIARHSAGSARVALQLLDQVQNMDTEEEILDVVETSVPDAPGVYDLYRALMSTRSTWKQIATLINKLKSEGTGSSALYALSNTAANSLLTKQDKRCALILDCVQDFLDGNSSEQDGWSGVTLCCYRIHNQS